MCRPISTAAARQTAADRRRLRQHTSFLSATVGVICLAAGLHGYFLRDVRTWERAFLLAAAILLIKPGYVTDGIGLALLAAVVVNQRFLNRAAGPASQPAVK